MVGNKRLRGVWRSKTGDIWGRQNILTRQLGSTRMCQFWLLWGWFGRWNGSAPRYWRGVVLQGGLLTCLWLGAGMFSGGMLYAQEAGSFVVEEASNTFTRNLKAGEIFSIRVVLVTEQDIIILSSLDKRYVEEVNTIRGEGEVLFIFRALRAGETKLVFDRIQAGQADEYLIYEVVISAVPSSSTGASSSRGASAEQRRIAAREEEEALREQRLYHLVREVIQTGDPTSAERAYMRVADELSSEYDYRGELILELAALYQENNRLDDAARLIREELERNEGTLTEALHYRFRVQQGRLDRLQGNLASSMDTWLLLKDELIERTDGSPVKTAFAEYTQVLFEIGETLFALEEDRSAEGEYQRWLELMQRGGGVPEGETAFWVYYRLAVIYERASMLRDFKRAYDYYGLAENAYKQLMLSEMVSSDAYAEEIANIRVRQQFIYDHFINIR